MTLRLNGDSSGFTEIKAADTAGDNSIKLPAGNGSANQLLKNSGTAGELEFASDICVDSSSRLLVGTTSFTGEASIVVEGSSAGGNTQAQLWLNRGQTDPVIDNVLGQIIFGDATASGSSGAMIQARADNSWGGVNGNPTRLAFFTESQGSDDGPSERLRITNNGTISLLNSPGIDFSGIQTNNTGMTSEILDSYEEGTWTPVGANNFNSITNADGAYVKVGNIVWISFQFNYSSMDDTTSSGAISGLPFTPGDANPNTGVEASGITYANNKFVIMWVENNGQMYFGTTRPLEGSVSTGSDFFRGSLVYSI
jgi:hypothetical protein